MAGAAAAASRIAALCRVPLAGSRQCAAAAKWSFLMATKRMLIDASHPEEMRVAVVDGNRLEEYDVEVASRRQLKGNIYLAKVTRVEPSLQAAFVDYGGNRHGFLAFSEIHPDYYQIPVADRQALLAEHAAAERAAEDVNGDADDEDDEIERRRPRLSPRNYKIQEVIKRRQILLVQVTKEERGTKGAALTTYLSLAGRYCVLMPNTARGGGISRKISNVTDRKRLKKIMSELEVADGMAVIVRTAGAGRTKAEIKRDYEYLLRLWSNIRETTLQSTAPALVYEEGSLIKRSIRDLYDRDTEEIIVQGESQYRIAKEFMKLFIPSHAKRVKLYEQSERPLFHQAQVEDQIEAMHKPIVNLRSGSYIVINPTEALVAIDVNSGRATRERHIEETALRTNLEAADEIARQLRLRDLAGLIVIDFIDMANPRNQTQVERRLKEAMKNDRARVQIGRISPFGLLELSRQRMRPSVLETSFEPCPMCSGTGLTRTIESAALSLLRLIEDEGIRHRAGEIVVTAGNAIAVYLLNYKRRALTNIEERYGFHIRVVSDPMRIGHEFKIERLKAATPQPTVARADEEVGETAPETEEVVETAETEADENGKRGRRRRPRRRRRGDEDRSEATVAEPVLVAAAESEAGLLDEADAMETFAVEPSAEDEDGEAAKKRRRRGKRGGRRRGKRPAEESAVVTAATFEAGEIQAEEETVEEGASDEEESAGLTLIERAMEDEEDFPSPSVPDVAVAAGAVERAGIELAPAETAAEPLLASDDVSVVHFDDDDEEQRTEREEGASAASETASPEPVETVAEAGDSEPWREPVALALAASQSAGEIDMTAVPPTGATMPSEDRPEVAATPEAAEGERPCEAVTATILVEPETETPLHATMPPAEPRDETRHPPRRGWWQRLMT
jgi:ribonuclease E